MKDPVPLIETGQEGTDLVLNEAAAKILKQVGSHEKTFCNAA